MSKTCQIGNLIHFSARWNVRIEHQKMQLFSAFLVVNSRDQHAAGVDAHHGPGWQIRNGDARFADQLFRLVVFVDAGKDDSIRSGTVVQREFQEFFGLFDRLAGFDLHGAEVGFLERLKIDKVLKERLDLHMGEVDDFLLGGRCGSGFDLCIFFLRKLERLHCRDKIPHMEKLCRSPVNTVLCLQVTFSRV